MILQHAIKYESNPLSEDLEDDNESVDSLAEELKNSGLQIMDFSGKKTFHSILPAQKQCTLLSISCEIGSNCRSKFALKTINTCFPSPSPHCHQSSHFKHLTKTFVHPFGEKNLQKNLQIACHIGKKYLISVKVKFYLAVNVLFSVNHVL